MLHRASQQSAVGRAGRSYESEEEVAGRRAQLLVKGLKSMWRMAPGILRSTLGGAVHRIILDDDVEVRMRWQGWKQEAPQQTLCARCINHRIIQNKTALCLSVTPAACNEDVPCPPAR